VAALAAAVSAVSVEPPAAAAAAAAGRGGAEEPPPAPDAVALPPAPAPAPKKASAFRRAPNKAAPAAAPSDLPAPVPAVSQTGPADPAPAPAPAALDPKHQKLTFSGTVREDAAASAAGSALGAEAGESIDNSPDQCCKRILAFIKTAVAPPPNPATVATPHLKANMLYLLDKISQDIMTGIVRHQNNAANAYDPLLFTEYDRALELHRIVSLAELQRHRRQFVKVNSQIPPRNEIDIGAYFIDFLALQL
jgi:hypothetical protein